MNEQDIVTPPRIKQVIVMRADLKMRRGKEIAQGSHASGEFMEWALLNGHGLSLLERHWINTGKTKICVRVNSEQELLDVEQQAIKANLRTFMITDLGLTEFDGPTKTCLAIGPDFSDKIDPVTKHLKLY